MQQRYPLPAEKRLVFGNKVKKLRREGRVPANIYGHNIEPMAVTISLLEYRRVFKQAGETALLDLQIQDEELTRPVLIHSSLSDPATNALLHVDFYQVNLKEKLTATVPLEFVGESPVVKNKEGILLEMMQEVEVESLPTEIPQSLTVDISSLIEMDQAIHVSDLVMPTGVEMLTDGEEMICKIEAAQMAEEVPDAELTPEAVDAGTTDVPTAS